VDDLAPPLLDLTLSSSGSCVWHQHPLVSNDEGVCTSCDIL